MRRLIVLLLPTLSVAGCAEVLGLDKYCDPSIQPCPTSGSGGGSSTVNGSGSTSTSTGGSCTGSDTRACYDGPSGTLGIGLCKGGTQTCTNGMWGGCLGEVVPTKEKCVLGSGDEDCNGSACSEPLWVRAYPNANTNGVDFSNSGDVYVGGFFAGDAWGLTSKGSNPDGFVAKLDGKNGNQIWSVPIGDTGKDFVRKVRAHGNTVTAIGITQGGTLGGAPLSSGLFIAQFSDAGKLNWIKGCAGGTLGDLSIDPLTGDAMVVGYYSSLDCGTGLETAQSPSDVFAARFAAADGTPSLRTWSPTGDNYVEGGAADLLGAQIISGYTATPWTWNGHSLPAGAFIAKAAASGAGITWALSPGNGLVFQVAAGKNIAVAASCTGPFNFGGGALAPVGAGAIDDICVANLSSAGGEVWAKRLGSGQEMSANSIAIDDMAGETFVLGHAVGGSTPVDTLTATESDFLVALDPSGKAEWVDSMTFNLGAAIAVNTKYVAIAGSFHDPANIFGPLQPKVAGVSDTFVAIVQR